jgi:hypothetical protein
MISFSLMIFPKLIVLNFEKMIRIPFQGRKKGNL